MDQDYHYYATYTAARLAGWPEEKATLVARAANYVDFFNEDRFRGYWKIMKDKKLIRRFDYPRYTFQANLAGNVVGAEGIWAAFHFMPGNYNVQQSLKIESIPSRILDKMQTKKLEVRKGSNDSDMWRLTRPLSHLSRSLVKDTHELAQDLSRIRRILVYGPGLEYLYDKGKTETVELTFLAILTGIRAHVIADTWAHQDFAGVPTKLNTYYDIKKTKEPGKYGIDFATGPGSNWHYIVLGRAGQKNPYPNMPKKVFEAAPGILGKLAYLGHGWLGHLPDYSFIKYKYRPVWKQKYDVHERNNPAVYLDAFYDMLILLHLAGPMRGREVQALTKTQEAAIRKAIGTGWSEKETGYPRVFSAEAWRVCLGSLGISLPPLLDTKDESGKKAELEGGEKERITHKAGTRYGYGTFTMEIMKDKLPSHFYLFQLAADYHFQYVKAWLRIFQSHDLGDSWSKQPGPLGGGIEDLVNRRVKALKA